MISVVVITYNQEHTVGQTLDSILSQRTDFAFEVIIGEDCSPSDNTRAVCESYVAKYPNIVRLMPAAANKGLLRNYADCLAACKGKYIAACAGDDWWCDDDKLQMQVDFLEANPDYGVVHTDMDMLDVNTGRITKSSQHRCPPEGSIFNDLFKRCFIYAPTTMYRRSLLSLVDFDLFTRLNFKMEDYPMWLEMSRHTKFHFINQSTVTYRVSSSSLSHSDNIVSRIIFLDEVVKIQNYFYDKYKPQLNEPLSESQHRMYYMDCLNYSAYRMSFGYVDGMGFPWFISFMLHTYIGGWICRKVISSSYYKRKK